MSVSLPNGSLVHIASGIGSVLTVSAVTNANPAVATSTAHGMSNGDYIELFSGWSRLNNRVFRIANVAANTFELEGVNTTSTTVYPAAGGTGTAYKITGWTQLQQILGVSSSGGDQQFATYQFLEDDAETRIPTVKAAAGLEFEVADDPSLTGYILAATANDDRVPRAIKLTTASSAKTFYYAYVGVNKTPSMNVNQPSQVKVTMSFVNPEPTRYST